MLIHSTSPHKPNTISHEGRIYSQLGQAGEYGHGVFDVPTEVAEALLPFPGWNSGDPAGAHAITITAPPVLDNVTDDEVEVEDEAPKKSRSRKADADADAE